MISEALLREDLGTLSQQQLEDAITELCAHMNAAEFRLIELVGEWESRGLPEGCGESNVARWLGFQCGIDAGAAREKVRVGKALRNLPRIRETFARGAVSYSKVRALTRVATPDNEALLLGYAHSGTAAQIEKLVRGYRRLERLTDPETVLRQRRFRGLRWYFDEDGMLVLEGRFPPEDGALMLKAIEGVKERMYREERAEDSDDRIERSHGRVEADVDCATNARRADALMRLVEAGAAHDPAALSGGDRTLVVLHVPVPEQADDMASEAVPVESRPATIEQGPALARETARRLACDASVVVHTERADGEAVSIGRRSRTVPHWMRRALLHRDGGCRFPGCTRSHGVDAHHIRHWADGGATAVDNLVLLCRQHHRMLHEEGFGCERGGDGDVVFRKPDGQCLSPAGAPQAGDLLGITELNRRRGLGITAKTCAAGWDGRRVDFSEAICGLWHQTTGSYEVPMPGARREAAGH